MCTQLRFQKEAINILFVSNAEIKKFHKQFMNDPTATDVMTFVDSGLRRNDACVDIIISLDQAAKQAKPRGLSLLQEASLLIGHALLHAKGFDDLTPVKALEMRRQEFELLTAVL